MSEQGITQHLTTGNPYCYLIRINDYKLQKNDYLKLWFFLSPEEIKEEFGEWSHSPRHIRRMYQQVALRTHKKGKRDVIERFENEQRLNQPESEVILNKEIEEVRKAIVSNIWRRIEENEQLWDFT